MSWPSASSSGGEIGLGVEHGDLGRHRPASVLPALPSRIAGGVGVLALGQIGEEHLPDLEQRQIGIAAVLVAARRGEQARQQEGRMSVRSAAMALASCSSALPPPKRLASSEG